MQVAGPQKKKSRVRNRTRNKANRVPINEEVATIEQSTISTHPVIVEPASEKGTKQSLETSAAIQVIQKLIRKNLLTKFENNKSVDARSNTLVNNLHGIINKSEMITQLQNTERGAFKKDSELSPSAILSNMLEGIFSGASISEVETSDDDDNIEHIEYLYKPRQYFLVSLCNFVFGNELNMTKFRKMFCKADLTQRQWLPCKRCGLTYYCCEEHMKDDKLHHHLCCAICQVTENNGTNIFYNCGEFSPEQFRSFRIVCIKKVESIMNRLLTAAEQEVLLFPRICNYVECRENRFHRLSDCIQCGEAAFCKTNPAHLSKQHKNWCSLYRLFKALIQYQEKFGRLEPVLPCKMLKELPVSSCNTKHIFNKLEFAAGDTCEYAAISQLSTGPLTAWYALKLCDRLKCHSELTIHLIGAEIEFEVDLMHKWELFLLHITPAVNKLNVVFIGPELNPRNISFDQLKKTKCCRLCHKINRTVCYYFENELYHRFCLSGEVLTPQLVCFFNPGLYRSTGFALEDTWPETIRAAVNFKCPIVVTSYTKYEAHLDMGRFIQEANRHLSIILPPTVNPFASDKPERNFISDDVSPLMFKNYYCFLIE